MTRRTNRLTDGDLDRLKRTIVDAIDERVPVIVAKYFELIGLNISTPEARDDVRANMTFLRGLHQGAQEAKRATLRQLVAWLLGLTGAAVAAAWAFSKLRAGLP